MSSVFFKRAPLGVAIILLSGSLTAHAVETTKLEKVIVSATRSETVQLPLASTITVIDEEQIRQSGATQVAEVLRIHAGIQLQDFDGSGGRNVTIGMRGFTDNAPNNTLVLVDGRRLNNASLSGPALSTVAIRNIERIEIVHGSAGVLYGDQAVGGVINIITKRATSGESNGSIQLLGGSDNLQSLAANLSQGFANGVSYSLSAQKRDVDNYRDNNESDYTNVLGNIRYDFTRGHVFAEGLYVDDQLNLPGSLSEVQAAENPRQTFTPNDFSDQETKSWRVGGGLTLTNNWELLAEYSDRNEDSYSEYAGSGYAQNLDTQILTPRLVGSFDVATGSAVITVGYDRHEAEYSSTASWGSSDTAQDSNGYYGQLVLPLTQALTTTMGTRYANVKDVDNLSSESHSASLNAQEFGLSYQITSSLRAFVRYAEGFRFANADENAWTPMDVTYLAPQTSESQEIGLAWNSDLFSATLAAYRMDVENEIMYDSPNFVNINLPKSERQGVMLDTTFVLSQQVSLRTNYTYTDAQLAAGTFSGNSVPYVAENTANIAVIFTPLETITATLDANYIGSRYLVGDDANSADKIESVTLLNANLLWTVRDNLELGLRVKNLTDESYADYNALTWNGNVQYPQPGRTFSASVTYSF